MGSNVSQEVIHWQSCVAQQRTANSGSSETHSCPSSMDWTLGLLHEALLPQKAAGRRSLLTPNRSRLQLSTDQVYAVFHFQKPRDSPGILMPYKTLLENRTLFRQKTQISCNSKKPTLLCWGSSIGPIATRRTATNITGSSWCWPARTSPC